MKSTSNETKSTTLSSCIIEKSSISTTSHSLKEQKIRENEIIDNKLNKTKKWHTTLNPNNILITKKEIQDILLKGNIKIEINDLSMWQSAFTHKSYILKSDTNLSESIDSFEPNSNIDTFKDEVKLPEPEKKSQDNIIPLQEKSNERLEWLGDAKIQGSVSYYLWERFPDQDEGFLTKLRSKLVKTKNLAFLATKLGFSPYLLLSYHVEFGCQGRTNQRILENTFESFIGAMFVDFTNKKNEAYGYEIVRVFLITIIQKYVDMVEMIIKDENSKDQLMWYFQKKFNGSFPIYLKEKNENECFYIFIQEPNSEIVVGKGHARSKKQAEQNAAKNALSFYAKQDVINKK
jgi:dsRNA-specific ribonuclease